MRIFINAKMLKGLYKKITETATAKPPKYCIRTNKLILYSVSQVLSYINEFDLTRKKYGS